MALCGAAVVPEQSERGLEREPAPVSPSAAGLTGQPLGCGLTLPLLLPIMGQLSKSFVMQHFLPSFLRLVGERG